ncbi:macrophage-stimulating protein receptor-like [Liolophura sinensis]|uniref:macrophage-stimulating protein receptor-like n=1 Tax=Liolophura sinensis TaxID=3198878 RepID=UPI0031597FDE
MTNFLADLPRQLTNPIWNKVVCAVATVMFCMSGTQHTLAENVALEKMVNIMPEGICTSYCDNRQGDCISQTCNDTCPSGITTQPRVFDINNNTSCAQLSVPRISDMTTEQRTVIYAFSNDSSECTVSKTFKPEKSFTLVFWVKVSSDLACDPPSQPCFVLWIRDLNNQTNNILEVQAGLGDLEIKSKSGSIRLDLKLTSWKNVTILVSEDMLAGIPNGELKNAVVLNQRLNLTRDVEVVWGVKNGADISRGIFAVADIKLYSRAVDGREINKMKGVVDEPRVAPECRCGVPALIETGSLTCKNVNGGSDVSRVNLQAHYIEYVNDGDVGTVWISDARNSSNISIDLGATYQIFNITIKFGTSMPQTVMIDRVFGSTPQETESRDIRTEPETEPETVFSWDVDIGNRFVYEKTLATKVNVVLQGHADVRDYHSIAEIFITGSRACYGNPSTRDDCAPCGCHESGSNSTSCNVGDGKCSCKSKYQGRDCSSCVPGYWGLQDCKKCPECKPLGSLYNNTCDSISGQCFCVGGVTENKDCDAFITDIVPTYGPLAGGTRVTIHGQLLGEGSNFTVFMNNTRQISHSRNHTSLVFETQNSSSSSRMDIRVELGQGVERKLNTTKFEYRMNPSVRSITPSVSIVSGGILLTVTGSNLNSVYKPVLVAYNSFNTSQAKQECLVEPRSSTDMYCPSPSLNQSEIAGENYFRLGIEFDGFEDYLRLPESAANLTFREDPIITLWSETQKFTYPFNQVIRIMGFNLTMAAKQTDYSVKVGSEICVISLLSGSQIVCVPPQSLPNDAQLNVTDTVNVMVKVGFLQVMVGQLHYIRFYKSKEFIGIMAGIAGLFILIIVAIVVRKCRKGRIRRPSVPGCRPTRPGSMESYNQKIRPELPPIPHPTSLFDRLDNLTQEGVMNAKVDKEFFTPGKICTKKGELARIIDGQFTNQSPVSPGTKLTIKAFVNAVQENAPVPPWAKQALKQAVYFRGHIHPNVLELLGVGFDKTRAYFLYHHMSNRSLKEYIVNPQIDIQHNELLEYALQIAEGMEFLSSRGLQHKDLATRNCMVDENLVIKISDIAFASDLYRSEYVYDKTQDIYRPLRWMALEYMKGGYHDTKSDVWSYGIVVWELFNRGLLPYHDISDDNIQSNLEDRNRPEKPPIMSDKMDTLMLSCWDETRKSALHLLTLWNALKKKSALVQPTMTEITSTSRQRSTRDAARFGPAVFTGVDRRATYTATFL